MFGPESATLASLTVLGLVQAALVCLTVLCVAFLVCLCLPGSPLKDIMQRLLAVLLCLAYCLSPVDIVPEVAFGPVGLLDDAAALLVAFDQARRLVRGRKEEP